MRSIIAALLGTIIYASDETDEAEHAAGHVEDEIHGYNYEQNGADWGSVNPLCDTGTEQSPIDLNEGENPNDIMEINGFGY